MQHITDTSFSQDNTGCLVHTKALNLINLPQLAQHYWLPIKMVHSLLVSRPNKTNPALSGQEHKVSVIHTQMNAKKYTVRSTFKKYLSHSTVNKNIHLTIATLSYFLLYGHLKISDASTCFFSRSNLMSPISRVLVDNDNSNIIKNSFIMCKVT